MLLNVVTPVFLLAGFANAGIKTVGRIGILIERLQIRLGMIQMADVVLGRILRTTLIEDRQHLFFQRMAVRAFFTT